MTDCNRDPVTFSSLGSKAVVADFLGGRLTSDAGALLLREIGEETADSARAEETPEEAETDNMPFWKRVEELRKTVPAEEWAKLPSDGSRQIDHYIYGSPKRPVE